MNPHLKDMFKRAESWPISAQEALLQAGKYIEAGQSGFVDLDEEDWKILHERRKAAMAGDFASDAEVKAMFNRFRRT